MISKSGHRLYLVSLWVKVVFAVAEGFSGLAIYFVTIPQIRHVVSWILGWKIFAHPSDRRTVVMHHLLGGLQLNAKTFLAVYLLLHGLLKIGLVAGLLSGKRWAYPLGLFGLGAFVLYQLYHFSRHGNPAILVLAGFDVFIMWLVWKEWREKMRG
jgi:uncharacterized membrane protein